MLFRELLWPGVLLPALVAAVACGAALLVARVRIPSAIALGVGTGYFAAHTAIGGVPRMPAVESSEWLAWLVLASALLVAPLSALRRAWPALLGTSLLVGSGLWLTVRPLARYTWSTAQTVLWLTVLAALAIAFLIALARSAGSVGDGGPASSGRERSATEWTASGLAPGLVLVIAGALSSVALVLSASARLAQLCGALVAALVAALLAAALSLSLLRSRAAPPPTPRHPGAALLCGVPVVLAYTMLLVNGALYAQLDRLGAVALWLAPCAGLLLLPARPSSSRLRRYLVAPLATVLLASPALALAVRQAMANADDPYAYAACRPSSSAGTSKSAQRRSFHYPRAAAKPRTSPTHSMRAASSSLISIPNASSSSTRSSSALGESMPRSAVRSISRSILAGSRPLTLAST